MSESSVIALGSRPMVRKLTSEEMAIPFCHLTCDLEDYKHATMMALNLPPRRNPEQVERGINVLLDIIKAVPGDRRLTFFTTGQVARDQPDVIESLSRQGHEIACHSDVHENVWDLTPDEFDTMLTRAVQSLEDASGQRMLGFRAPDFSIDRHRTWAYAALARAGFVYDSSMVWFSSAGPAVPPDADEVDLVEFPVYAEVLPFGATVRVMGGTYFRVLPLDVIVRMMMKVFRAGFVPIVYIHPSDLDPRFEPVTTAEMRALGPKSAWWWALRQKQWSVCTRSAARKLEALLRVFPNRGPLHERARAVGC